MDSHVYTSTSSDFSKGFFPIFVYFWGGVPCAPFLASARCPPQGNSQTAKQTDDKQLNGKINRKLATATITKITDTVAIKTSNRVGVCL